MLGNLVLNREGLSVLPLVASIWFDLLESAFRICLYKTSSQSLLVRLLHLKKLYGYRPHHCNTHICTEIWKLCQLQQLRSVFVLHAVKLTFTKNFGQT